MLYHTRLACCVTVLSVLVFGKPWGMESFPPQQQGMGFGGMGGNPDPQGIPNFMGGGGAGLAALLGGGGVDPAGFMQQQQPQPQHRHISRFSGGAGGEMQGGLRGEEQGGAGRLDVQVTQRSSNCAEKAKNGDKIAMHYTGRLKSNGQVFDSSIERGEPLEFTLGAGEVIKGWDKGILGMCVGERRRLTIPPALAYGDEGMGPIPAHSTLVFDIKLVGIKEHGGRHSSGLEGLAGGMGGGMDSADPLNYFKMMGAMGKK